MWEKWTRRGLGEELSQEQRDVVCRSVLLRILVTVCACPRFKKNFRTTIVNSSIIPQGALDFDHTGVVVSGPPNTLPKKIGIKELCGQSAVPAFESFEAAGKAVMTCRGKRDVVLCSLEEYQREVGTEQFKLETDEEFFLSKPLPTKPKAETPPKPKPLSRRWANTRR
jgi:hypothetical protein